LVLLSSFFFYFQISCKENVEETSQFCAQLLYLYCNHGENLDLDVGKNLVTYGLELCKVSQAMGMDSHAVLQALLHLSRKTPQVSGLLTWVN
jgi:hypothetical protein